MKYEMKQLLLIGKFTTMLNENWKMKKKLD